MLNKIGLPKQLVWGFLGVVLFMMGDGLEQGWLSPFLIENGLTVQQSVSIFTVYGISLAIASWFSGVCLEAFGAKRTMFMGLLFYIIGTAAFISYGFEHLNLPVMYVTYFIKGLGYPLFAYSFLTWVIYRSPKNRLGTAVGWFWIALLRNVCVRRVVLKLGDQIIRLFEYPLEFDFLGMPRRVFCISRE